MKNVFPMHENLICLAYVFHSHDDFTVIEDLYAGFDNNFNLIILCEHTDIDEPDFNCATCAILKKDEAFRLAKRLKVSLQELPMEISDAMSDWRQIACPMPNDVIDCLKGITECLIDEGCHFHIRRKLSANGFISC